MLFADNHIHTLISGDSDQTIDTVCEDALKHGIERLCITEHADFEPGCFYYRRFDYDKIKSMADYARKKYPSLVIKTGAEIDYQINYLPEIFDFVMAYDLDYLLGSVHKIGGIPVVSDAFYTDKREEEAYTEYFQTLREMVCTNMFNCVAHLDFIKRGANEYYGKFRPEKYKDLICDVLKETIKRDMTLEINTNGFHWKSLNDFYPDMEIIRWYKDLGGENINFASDSHKIHHLGYKIQEMYDLIRELGFDKITVYSNKVKEYIYL